MSYFYVSVYDANAVPDDDEQNKTPIKTGKTGAGDVVADLATRPFLKDHMTAIVYGVDAQREDAGALVLHASPVFSSLDAATAWKQAKEAADPSRFSRSHNWVLYQIQER